MIIQYGYRASGFKPARVQGMGFALLLLSDPSVIPAHGFLCIESLSITPALLGCMTITPALLTSEVTITPALEGSLDITTALESVTITIGVALEGCLEVNQCH